MIKIKNLKKEYKNFNMTIENFQVKKGEFLVFLGQSGSGKSTLLNLVSGIDKEYSGEILIDGESVEKTIKKGEIAMVFQDSLLLPHLNVFENIAFGLKIRKINKKEIIERVNSILNKLELKELKERFPSELSGGQKQRVSIGRAIVMNPKLLLMDEPFSALDMSLREKFQYMIKKIHEELGITTLFVTHDREEAFFLANTIAVVHNGKIEQLATPIELYNAPETEYIANFLGIENIFLRERDEELLNVLIGGLKDIAIPSENIRVTDKETTINGILKEKNFKTGFFYMKVDILGKIMNIKQNRIDFPLEIGDRVNVKLRKQDIIFINNEVGNKC